MNQKLKKRLNHRLDHIEILAFFVILFPVTLKILIRTSNFIFRVVAYLHEAITHQQSFNSCVLEETANDIDMAIVPDNNLLVGKDPNKPGAWSPILSKACLSSLRFQDFIKMISNEDVI